MNNFIIYSKLIIFYLYKYSYLRKIRKRFSNTLMTSNNKNITRMCFFCDTQDIQDALEEIKILNKIIIQCKSRNLCRKRHMIKIQEIGCTKCKIKNVSMTKTENKIILCKACFILCCMTCGIEFNEFIPQIRTNSLRRICKNCHDLAIAKSQPKLKNYDLNSSKFHYYLLYFTTQIIKPILSNKIIISIGNIVYNFFQ